MKTFYYIKLSPVYAAVADLSDWENNHWCIHRINVPEKFRGKGYGSKLLKQICDDADKEKQVLILQIYSSGDMSDEDLIEWYERYGFTEEKESYSYIRYPKPGILKDSENSGKDLPQLCYNRV